MRPVLAHLRARSTELSSIVAGSGAAGCLVFWALGVMGARQAIGAGVMAIIGYVWPQSRAAALPVIPPAIAPPAADPPRT